MSESNMFPSINNLLVSSSCPAGTTPNSGSGSPCGTPKLDELYRVKVSSTNCFDLGRQAILSILKQYDSMQEYDVWCIFGEATSTYILETCLNSPKCKHIRILVGPKFRSVMTRDKIKELMEIDEQNDDKKITLIVLPIRPTYHGIMIGNSLFVEDEHTVDENYEWATVVPVASKDSIKRYLNNFFGYLKIYPYTKVNSLNIEKIPFFS